MKFMIFVWLLLLGGSSMAEGLRVSYQAPLIPLEISVDENGFEFSLSENIITPLGKFNLGYSAYKAEFEEKYTYVIIEDMNTRKEYIYKVKDKQTLRLVNKGTTGVEITKNKVRIMIEKGSEFKLEFEVVDDSPTYVSTDKWITPSSPTCRSKGGKISSDGACKANWEDAKAICRASGGHLPNIEELKAVVSGCGGTFNAYTANRKNSSYQKCYKEKGFVSDGYWSSFTVVGFEGNAWGVNFNDGGGGWDDWSNSYYVRCVRDGQ